MCNPKWLPAEDPRERQTANRFWHMLKWNWSRHKILTYEFGHGYTLYPFGWHSTSFFSPELNKLRFYSEVENWTFSCEQVTQAQFSISVRFSLVSFSAPSHFIDWANFICSPHRMRISKATHNNWKIWRDIPQRLPIVRPRPHRREGDHRHTR